MVTVQFFDLQSAWTVEKLRDRWIGMLNRIVWAPQSFQTIAKHFILGVPDAQLCPRAVAQTGVRLGSRQLVSSQLRTGSMKLFLFVESLLASWVWVFLSVPTHLHVPGLPTHCSGTWLAMEKQHAWISRQTCLCPQPPRPILSFLHEHVFAHAWVCLHTHVCPGWPYLHAK